MSSNPVTTAATSSRPRTATISRATRETTIRGTLNLDGRGSAAISTGIGFLDHMLTALAVHARLDLELSCTGDLQVDDHHTAEDVAIVLGQLIDAALGDRAGIARYGAAYAPLDEALARTVIDLCTRPVCECDLRLVREKLGELSCENVPHVLRSLAISGRFTLHVDVLKGSNDHHKAEAAFKSLALALRQAVAIDPALVGTVASTKGVL
jgi:imidazoleglycerol phosphate dehydratase HisB